MHHTAQAYRRDLWNDGTEYVEIWLEKEALAGVLVDVTDPWDVPLMVTRGYSSISYLHSAAETIYGRAEQGKHTTIYYFGDRDPSGVDIDRAVRQGIGESLGFIEQAHIPEHDGDDPNRMIGRALASGDWETLGTALDQRNAEINEMLHDLTDWFQTRGKPAKDRPPTRAQLRHERLMAESPDYARSNRRAQSLGCIPDDDDEPEDQAAWKEATFSDFVTFERVAVTEEQIAGWGSADPADEALRHPLEEVPGRERGARRDPAGRAAAAGRGDHRAPRRPRAAQGAAARRGGGAQGARADRRAGRRRRRLCLERGGGVSDHLDKAARRLAEVSCEAQGIEVKITDPVVIGKVAAMLKGEGSDLPLGRDALRVEAVEAAPGRVDRDVVEDGREDRPLATERQTPPRVAEG